VAILLVDTTWLMPHFRGTPYPHLVNRYGYLGRSMPEVLVSVLLRPHRWLPVVLELDRARYLLALLAPLAFLPLLAPRTTAAALPGLAMNLMSTDPVLFHHRTQYQSFVLPFLVLGAVEGLAALRRTGYLARVPASAPLAAAAVISVVLTARTVNELGVSKLWHGPEQRAARALVARVPAGVPVSANERLVPHLAERQEVYAFPDGVQRSRWIIERDDQLARHPPEGFVPASHQLAWTLLRRAGND
jgi:uncharacterized membrane protein